MDAPPVTNPYTAAFDVVADDEQGYLIPDDLVREIVDAALSAHESSTALDDTQGDNTMQTTPHAGAMLTLEEATIQGWETAVYAWSFASMVAGIARAEQRRTTPRSEKWEYLENYAGRWEKNAANEGAKMETLGNLLHRSRVPGYSPANAMSSANKQVDIARTNVKEQIKRDTRGMKEEA